MRKRVLIGLTVLLLCFIWGNSLMPATMSGAFSQAVKEFINRLLGQAGTPVLTGDGVLRKVAHGTEFAALGAVLLLLIRSELCRPVSLLILAGLITAITDETIQLFVCGRAGQIRDVWIDFGGFLCGVLLALLFSSLRRKHAGGSPGN